MDQQAKCGQPASLAFPLPALVFRIGLVVLTLASTTAWTQSAMDGFLPAPNATVRAIAVQADGYILAGGDFTQIAGVNRRALARLRADGSIDAGFNALLGNGEVHAIAVQADGRILIGGTFTQIGVSQRLRIARLHPDGSLDASFNPGANDTVRALLIEADGSILAGGDFTQLGGQTRNRVARILATGTLDGAFQPSPNGSVLALAVLPDGRIWLGGEFTQVGPFPRSRLARLHSSGSLDQTQTRTANATVRSIVVDVDGSTLIGGDFTEILVAIGPAVTRNRMARIGADDQLAAFNPNFNGPVHTILVMPDGHVIAGGDFTFVGIHDHPKLVRLSSAGSPTQVLFRPDLMVRALAIDGAGQFLVGGDFIDSEGTALPHLVRFERERVDRTLRPAAPDNTVYAISVDLQDRILMGGNFTIINAITRRGAARLDNRNQGIWHESFNPDFSGSPILAMAQMDNGDVVIGGQFLTVGGTPHPYLARVTGGSGSLVANPNPTAGHIVNAIALQPDGKFLVGGDFDLIAGQSRSKLARFHPNSSLDTSFISLQIDGPVLAIAIQADGRIVIGGAFQQVGGQPRNRLARLNANGSLDPGFNPGTGNFFVNTVALDSQGRILVGGNFLSLGGQPHHRFGRLLPDGQLDTSFNPGAGGSVTSIIPLVDGRIMISGYFQQIGGVTRNGIARLLADGSVDLDFEANTTTPGYVFGMALHPEGKIVVGGDFETLAGQTMANLGRLSVPDPVISKLEVNGSTVLWRRAGPAPEVAYAPELLLSQDGVNFTPIAVMERVQNGWAVQGFKQPVGEVFYLRVRTRMTSGYGNGSSGVLQVNGRFFGTLPDQIMADRFEL